MVGFDKYVGFPFESSWEGRLGKGGLVGVSGVGDWRWRWGFLSWLCWCLDMESELRQRYGIVVYVESFYPLIPIPNFW